MAHALFLARYIEKAGTGTLDMIARLRAAGLPEPVFEQDGGTFLLRLGRPHLVLVLGDTVAVEEGVGSESRSESRSEWWRSRSEWRPEWGPESVHERILREVEARPLSRSELALALGHKAVTGSLRRALTDLMSAGLVEYTVPEKPGSRLQRYRSTRPPSTESTGP